ncbi:hypothetical protein ACXX81_08595 [Pseudomonas sp. GNP013]|jgi:hypothetical protein|uniref:hypothetical protein n=1 Tax=unclassified Pseudomonas TaxID=196821 RepID=UPI001E4E4FB2|nr:MULTISPECIES: hypothetical protein [unclassified Pseudomonas]MEB0106871.1 hypothetical protein [Pseudomonas sp. MH9.3]WPX80511.1 hypothetical protein RHM60_05200 [Pseudomonas sp. MH9.3]WQG57567.1 hypothetical protein RHM66_21620 [Pseudomonas sp. RTB3]
MTTISAPPAFAFNAPHTAPTSPHPLKQPEVSTPALYLERHLEDISARVDRNTIDHMMRNLDSKESKDYFEKIDALLTPDNIKRLATGPKAKSHIKALAHIETRFNSGSIDKVSTPVEWKHVEDYRKAVEAELFELTISMLKAPWEKGSDLARGFFHNEIAPHILHGMHDLQSKCTHLSEIAKLVKNILESLQDAHLTERAQDLSRGYAVR